MDYSIVMPVFNREDLTKNCLATLLPTLDGAGAGEIIVVDNGSRPETAAVLAQFPWVQIIRNDENRGFAAACNQAARLACGRYLVHLNNDTVATDGWLARLIKRFDEGNVGIVGPRLLFPDDTIQHVGVMLSPMRLGPDGFSPFHVLWGVPGNVSPASIPRDYEVMTGACMVTPRDLYLELGGFDEIFWNGYEDVDYCLKVRARGLRVTYEPTAVLYHYESQSGAQRKRRLMHNVRELSARWGKRAVPDHNRSVDLGLQLRREQFVQRQRSFFTVSLPPITVIVHGEAPSDPRGFIERVVGGRLRPQAVLWAAKGAAPPNATPIGTALAAIADATETRADRYVAFVDTQVALESDWLSELVDTVEFARDIAAATVVAPEDENEWSPMTADAQCTLVKLAAIPQHLRVDARFTTVSGGVADWLERSVALGRSVRRSHRPTARVGSLAADPVFEERYGVPIAAVVRPDPVRMERISQMPAISATLASIVMLSWNAPEYTQIAVASIKRHTPIAHEIIIIDNGSDPETLRQLRELEGVRIIYNSKNMGFAHGCNQGMAAALGSHIVLLNNDVVVTAGWLEALLEAHRRDGAVGISAPRSNYVAGHQQLYDAKYSDMDHMHLYAAERSVRLRGRMYHADRVIGFCMCISRAVIDEVGGIDPRYGVGNFEDDDYCVRTRAAGYEIVVCEDSFIHHFGNVTFRANKVDWSSQMQTNWSVFAERWNLPRDFPTHGYDPRPAIRRGFLRERDFVALPQADDAAGVAQNFEGLENERCYTIAILATVRDESDWSRVAPIVGNYARALTADESVVFAIAAVSELDAATVGKRVERILFKAGIASGRCPDIDVSDVRDFPAWRERFAAAKCLALVPSVELAGLELLADRSRSGFTRLVRTLVAT